MANVDLASVRAHVEILRLAKQKQKEFKALETNAREAIEAAMGNADVGLLDGEPAIHWSSHKRTSFDQKAFREDNPELFEQYKSTTPVRKFDVL